MRKRLFLNFAQFKPFWQFRRLLKKVSFWSNNYKFKIQNSFKQEKHNYIPLRSIFRDTQKPLFFAIGVAALIQLGDYYLHPYFLYYDLYTKDSGDYITFLATISGIGSVFIGLYYAGITTVGGAIYAKVPNDIRGLLAQERFGNVYMRYLSFLTFFCLILIAFSLSNFSESYIAVPFVTVAAGIGIFAFVKLGQRAFNLFDPTALSSHIFEQLQRWVSSVVVGGYKWMDESFQLHAHRQANTALNTLETLVDITEKEPHLNGEPYVELTKNILIFLINYEHQRGLIPTKSQWFEKQYEHRDWYLSQDTYVSVAHQTGTSIGPEMTTNSYWIEDRLLKIVTRCILVNLRAERYSLTLGLLNYLDGYLKTLAKLGRASQGFTILEDLMASVNDLIANESESVVESEVLEKLAVIENFALMPISIALSYRDILEKFSRQDIENKLDNIKWENKSSLYKAGFASHCLTQLEWFQPRIKFEKETEGKVVTPPWYFTELILKIEAEQFVVNIESLVTNAAKLFEAITEKANSRKHPWLAAATMSREWEYLHKIDDQLHIWPKCWDQINSDRLIDGLPWPAFDFDAHTAKIQARRTALLKSMSQQNMLLALYKKPSGFPDYAGQFLHATGEVAFDALMNNDAALLESVFHPYMIGCLLKYDSLRPTATQPIWRTEQDFKIASAALLDLMDISGYAKLFADLHNNEALWLLVQEKWDDYLTPKDGTNPLALLAAAITITDLAFESPHRGILRIQWQQAVSWKMSEIPRHDEMKQGRFLPETVVDHDSQLIQLFAESRFANYDGMDVFIALYLRELPAAKDINFGNRRRDLKDRLERRNKNKASNAAKPANE